MHAARAACFQCGAVVDDLDGPTHPYMPSSPGCWAAFGALQADELTRFGYPPAHGLGVDAYAASHGGDGSQRRDRQSVCIHLMAICSILERGYDAPRRVALLQRLTRTKRDWPSLHRPAGVPALNLTDVRGAADLAAYDAAIRTWAGSVWDFWAPEHERIRALLDAG